MISRHWRRLARADQAAETSGTGRGHQRPLCGAPLSAGDEALAKRYWAVLESWQVVDLSADIAESAARLRVSLKMKLPDAVQAASAIAINADALVTHDRDFSRVTALKVIG